VSTPALSCAPHEALLRIGDDESVTSQPTQAGPPALRPAQLPSSLRGMTARPEAQELLDQAVRPGEAGTVSITAIGGMGGIGKTTLAVAWAHSLAPRFPDGQLCLNLRGFDPIEQVLKPMDALGDLLLALGAPTMNAEESLEARSARFRSLVADRKLLLLLDNARDAEQVRPLLPHNNQCLVIVTSRNQLASLVVREGAVPVRLDRMTDDQARELLTHRLGVDRVGLEGHAIDRIIAAGAGLPLALALVAARLAVDPDLDLGTVADELTGPSDRGTHLPGWSIGEQSDDLASVFEWSYRLLDDETARCFRSLAVHPGPALSLPVVAGITGHDLSDTRQLISRLVGASLLERHVPDRFVIHDLLREYAASRLDPTERHDAETRLVGHYVRSTRNAWNAFGRSPVGELDPVAELTALAPESFERSQDAIEWYSRERAVLPAVLHLAVVHGWDRAAANIAIDWRPMNQTVDSPAYTYPHALAALTAAERTGDPVLRAELHRDVGPKVAILTDLAAGQRHLEEARSLYALVGDRAGEANTLRNLANHPGVPRQSGLAHLRAAIALLQDEDDLHIQQLLKVHLADMIVKAGRDDHVSDVECLEAEQLLTEVIPTLRLHGWTYLMPSAASTLALVLIRLGRPREALVAVSEGKELASSDPFELAFLHEVLAESALASGERALAAQACRDFHEVVATMGRERFDDMVLRADSSAESTLFDRIQRIEAALAGETPSCSPFEQGSDDFPSDGP
jgi:hypothetical protein